MGRLQWHMLQFKLSLDPCSSGGPAGAQGGIHYNQTQAGFGQRLHRDTSPKRNKSEAPPLPPSLVTFYNNILQQRLSELTFYLYLPQVD